MPKSNTLQIYLIHFYTQGFFPYPDDDSVIQELLRFALIGLKSDDTFYITDGGINYLRGEGLID